MGIFNKFIKKSEKSSARQDQYRGKKQKEAVVEEKKKELTIAELQEKQPSDNRSKKIAGTAKKEDTKEAYKYLVRPLVSEKGTYLGALNQYVFEVNPAANKAEIKKAIKAVYGVKPINISIINIKGKKVRYGKTSGTTGSIKKAIITLSENEKIELYEGV